MASLFDSRIEYGQGKTATTILTEDGCYYPVIHEPYSHRAYYGQARCLSAPAKHLRGERPMHRTTLTIAKPPWSPDYTTTSNQYFSGSKFLEPAQRPHPCPSMHSSKVTFGTDEGADHFLTESMVTYQPQNILPAGQLHLLSLTNKVKQIEGAKVKEVVKPDEGPYSYWSQYNRIHNKLGILRGPGVRREYPVRQEYNIITGEEKGPAWHEKNPRVSGNRVLHGLRSQLANKPLLF